MDGGADREQPVVLAENGEDIAVGRSLYPDTLLTCDST